MNDYIVKGDGATCAHCGGTPSGRFIVWSAPLNVVAWACNNEHAQAVRVDISNGVRR